MRFHHQPYAKNSPLKLKNQEYITNCISDAFKSIVIVMLQTNYSSNQQGFAPIILLIIIILAVSAGVGGYFGYRSFSPVSPSSEIAIAEPTETPYAVPEVTPYPTPPPMPAMPLPPPILMNQKYVPIEKIWETGKVTYTNELVDFSFDYPNYMNLAEDFELNDDNEELMIVYPEQAKYRQGIFALFTPSPQELLEGGSDTDLRRKICDDRFSIYFTKYSNQDKEPLYKFIERTQKIYAAYGFTGNFDSYKKDLKAYSIPKSGSYIFDGKLSETPEKTIYFTGGENIYVVNFKGGCDYGESYSKEADAFFTTFLKNLKFK